MKYRCKSISHSDASKLHLLTKLKFTFKIYNGKVKKPCKIGNDDVMLCKSGYDMFGTRYAKKTNFPWVDKRFYCLNIIQGVSLRISVGGCSAGTLCPYTRASLA